ncbi:MAG: hypothetical protein SAL07_25675, partial [Oscillatoria sp. PMC 1051.18]|nr:hypothetical protein [Oscillatoria sp. PMC 1050.18]MEC5033298.1 hypothetical protein [Oscillatoria sp. PMC 1051.18]
VALRSAKGRGFKPSFSGNDFQELHQLNSVHSGILAVYQYSDPAKNMSYKDIIKAIANLETAEYVLENQFVVLNQWNY